MGHGVEGEYEEERIMEMKPRGWNRVERAYHHPRGPRQIVLGQ